MTKSDISPMPIYFDRYINMVDDVPLSQALQISLEELKQAPVETWRAIGDRVYAEGKWTIKQILQHLIDTERIFSYRALCFARGEKATLPSYEEEEYAQQADTTHRTLEELVAELESVRHALISLFNSFTPEMLQRTGIGFKGPYAVLAIGFILAGHQRWHSRIIEERYLKTY